MNRVAVVCAVCFWGAAVAGTSVGQERPHPDQRPGFDGGQGPRAGQGRRLGPQAGPRGRDDRHDADREVFHFLLQHHGDIRRTVTQLPDGVETLTESDSPEVADMIKEHVEWMAHRIEKRNPIRMRDPLFAELFRHADKIRMTRAETETGVRVTERSEDPYVVKLIQAHAQVVSGFVERGFAEARRNHAVPDPPPGDPSPGDAPTSVPPAVAGPVVTGHGAVVRLPDAAQQPRPDTKILVDLTTGGEVDSVNTGLEKVAKILNLYAGAGAESAQVQIAVVIHGEATLAVLDSESYSTRFNTPANPNLALLSTLHESGVDLYVCGQSLISHHAAPEDVAEFVTTAVSAITSIANLQADGYAYLPVAK